MTDFINFISTHAEWLSFGSAILALSAAFYSFFQVKEYSSSISNLIDRLKGIEETREADLSDATDRELRKIVSYINHRDVRNDEVSIMEKLSKNSGKDADFHIFVDGFRDLQEKDRLTILRLIKSQDLYSQAKFVRNLLVHSHDNITPWKRAITRELLHRGVGRRAGVKKAKPTITQRSSE